MPDLTTYIIEPAPTKKWRCTHGHKWESTGEMVGVQLFGVVFGLPEGESLKFCGLCVKEKLVAALGQVREA